MLENKARKVTESALETQREPRTSFFSADPAELWKEHYDKKFFKKNVPNLFTGSIADREEYATVNVPDVGEQGLPSDLTTKLSSRSPYVVSFYSLQEWDGFVLDVGEHSLTVRLTDLTNGGREDAEEAEIPLDELDEDTRSQLTKGQLFRWTIGYERSRSGQKTRISRIIVRRLPTWTKDDLVQAQEEGAILSKSLLWE